MESVSPAEEAKQSDSFNADNGPSTVIAPKNIDEGMELVDLPSTRESDEPMGGLAVMDEIYEAGEEELEMESEEEGIDEVGEDAIDLDDTLVELLDHVQDAINLDESDAAANAVPRVTVSAEFAAEVVDYLVSRGTLLFLSKYVLGVSASATNHPDGDVEDPDDPAKRPYPIADLLAALGFSLPMSVVNDSKFTSQQFEIALQIAIRYTLTHRRRLAKPRLLDDIVEAIRKANRILVVTGAGISTSLGIPDFRSDNGLYAQLAHLGLADPQEVFDIRRFREDPSIFYSVAAKILPREGLHSGTPTHKFIKLLNKKNKLLRNYTQNIDNLEQFVGIPRERVVQCHGSIGSSHCITCGYSVPDGESLFPIIEAGVIPHCPQCETRKRQGKRRAHGAAFREYDDDDEEEAEEDQPSFGVLKPDITFFGESLPARFDKMLFDEKDSENCDLILCMGTSLRVSPVSEIVKVVPRNVPQIYISKTPAKHVTFEAVFLGGCDDTVELLCQKLGWDLDHPMNKRSDSMSDKEYPGGTIEENDGVFKFVDTVPREEAATIAEASKELEAAETGFPSNGPKNEEESIVQEPDSN